MAEVMRLITVYLSGECTRDLKTYVKVVKYSDGRYLPKCIPVYLRGYIRSLSTELRRWEQPIETLISKGNIIMTYHDYRAFLLRVVRTLLSICAVMRSMSGHHFIKFSTVTAPHSGTRLTYRKP